MNAGQKSNKTNQKTVWTLLPDQTFQNVYFLKILQKFVHKIRMKLHNRFNMGYDKCVITFLILHEHIPTTQHYWQPKAF